MRLTRASFIGLTGTRLPFHRPWDGSAHKSSVVQHGQLPSKMEVRADTNLEHVHSCEQEILEAEARGENIRCSSESRKEEQGAVRLRNWQEDFTAFVMYCTPKLQHASSRASNAETLFCLARCLRKTLQDTSKRSTPHIMTDLTGRVGVLRNDDENEPVTGDVDQKEKGWRLPYSGTSMSAIWMFGPTHPANTLRSLCEFKFDSWSRCVPESLSAELHLHDVME